MKNVFRETLLESQTSSVNVHTKDDPLKSGHWDDVSFFLDVTAIIQNIELVILSQDPTSDLWVVIATTGTQTAIGTYRVNVNTGLDDRLAVRVRITGGGAQSTFSVGYVAKGGE